MSRLYLHGIGHFHPENVIDNRFLEELDIGTNDAWILERVGIRSRRTVLPLEYIKTTKNRDLRAAPEAALYSNAQTGARAAAMAIERAGIDKADIGLVVAGGCSPDRCIPAEASSIAKALGVECQALDLTSACSTFATQCHFLRMMGDNLPDYALCVVAENTTRVTDYTDRSTAVLFGDATAAAVVSTKHPAPREIVETTFGASPAGADEVVIPRTGFFWQNGSSVQKFAIKKMASLLSAIQAQVTSSRERELYFIGHQANLRALEGVAARCSVARDRHLHNIVEFGNQTAAGAPVVLSQSWDRLKSGDVVGMAVVGSGLAWASLQLEFR